MLRRILDHWSYIESQSLQLYFLYSRKVYHSTFFSKVDSDPPQFLEHIQGDICGPIDPPSGPFRYFMVLVDASTRWSHVCHLSTRNLAFAPDHPIKTIRLDNAGEFSSKAFHDYCMSWVLNVDWVFM